MERQTLQLAPRNICVLLTVAPVLALATCGSVAFSVSATLLYLQSIPKMYFQNKSILAGDADPQTRNKG